MKEWNHDSLIEAAHIISLDGVTANDRICSLLNSRERLIETQKDLLRGCQNFLYRFQDGSANPNVAHALSQSINDHLLLTFMENSK